MAAAHMKCRKHRFRDRVAAELAIQRRQLSGHKRSKTEIRSYLCPLCNRWHLTSQPRAVSA